MGGKSSKSGQQPPLQVAMTPVEERKYFRDLAYKLAREDVQQALTLQGRLVLIEDIEIVRQKDFLDRTERFYVRLTVHNKNHNTIGLVRDLFNIAERVLQQYGFNSGYPKATVVVRK